MTHTPREYLATAGRGPERREIRIVNPDPTSLTGPLGSTVHVLQADADTVAALAAVDWNRHFRRVCLDPARGLITLTSPSRLHEDLTTMFGDIRGTLLPSTARVGDGCLTQANHPPGNPGRFTYDNALAESIIGLYKTELIARRGPWRTCEAVELATLEWVHWYNHRRLFGPLGHVPPAAFEAHYYHQLHESAMAA